MRRAFLLATLAMASCAAPVFAQNLSAPMNATVRLRLMPQTEALLEQVMTQGRTLRLDGQDVFGAGDKFLGGKIADGMAFVIVGMDKDDPRLPRYEAGFRKLAQLTLHDKLTTWGIYYYMQALAKLKDAGRLEACLDPQTLAALKTKLDWRSFVDPDFRLIDLPNNYYGVAFSIAQLRHKLGWEDASGMTTLLDKTLAHYRTYSQYGFADETDGQGRFDRYSILLIGELSQRYIEAGLTPPPDVRDWLRESAKVLLLRLNEEGDGFEYGRSIGPYGETAFLEVLSAAATLNLLTPQERDAAYSYSSIVAQRYMDFWVDGRTGSVNMWEKGRKTDDYRGKNRILGENLSLARQYIYTNAEWNALGYRDVAPTTDLAAWRAAQPPLTLTWFAKGDYDRALVTVIDDQRLFGLPLINGGEDQHNHSPYFPLPFSPDLISGVPDGAAPQLIVRFTLADGTELEPLSYFRDVEAHALPGGGAEVRYDQAKMDRLGQKTPQPDARLAARTLYRFSKGEVTREDVFTPAAPLDVAAIDLEFASYSMTAHLSHEADAWRVSYGDGAAISFTIQGLQTCALTPVDDPAYRTPTGAFHSLLRCRSGGATLTQPLRISWRLTYNATGRTP
ncbi:MAG: hypothetical protein ACTHLA_10410 [Asticcacaulis sp.]|uniref:hypothetical protein n=1 Tax=Asticcacaulis sp. TaxID=1872648 RepID=UPI003F7CC480